MPATPPSVPPPRATGSGPRTGEDTTARGGRGRACRRHGRRAGLPRRYPPSTARAPVRAPRPPRASHPGGPAALLALLLAAPLAVLAEGVADDVPRGFGDVPFETLGETLRVREGHVADTVALEAIAAEAAADGAARSATADPHHPLLYGHPDEIWIADVGMLLYDDFDGDGFFAAFGLTVDVDIGHGRGAVYLSIALLDGLGAILLTHDTREFDVHGRAAGDGYRVEIELLDGYAADYHDVVVELRDATDGRLLDIVGAGEFASLRGLPLEGGHRPGHHVADDGTAFVAAGYAGAAGPLAALALCALALARAREHRGARQHLRARTGERARGLGR